MSVWETRSKVIQGILCNRVIASVRKLTEWVHLVAVVKKNKLRLCINSQKLNRVLKWETYSMPTMKDIQSRLKEASSSRRSTQPQECFASQNWHAQLVPVQVCNAIPEVHISLPAFLLIICLRSIPKDDASGIWIFWRRGKHVLWHPYLGKDRRGARQSIASFCYRSAAMSTFD